MNLAFNKNHPDEIERIMSSVADELKSMGVTISHKGSMIIINAPDDKITNILDKIKSKNKVEGLIIIEPGIPEKIAPEIKESDIISCIVTPSTRNFVFNSKSKHTDNVQQRKLYDRFAHARFNQQKLLQKQIKNKRK